jgi:uncharacterized RDD family membrane protein YckC
MLSDRVQRQIDRLLDQAEEAMALRRWEDLRATCEVVLDLDPENSDAARYLALANNSLGTDDVSDSSDILEPSPDRTPEPEMGTSPPPPVAPQDAESAGPGLVTEVKKFLKGPARDTGGGSSASGCVNCNKRSCDSADHFCLSCDQMLNASQGIQKADLSQRTIALLLDSVLVFVTLGIGWIVWSVFAWRRGQSPGKQLMNIRSVSIEGAELTWEQTFVREFLVKGLLFSLGAYFSQAVNVLWAVWDRNNQALHDKVVKTVVVAGPRETPVLPDSKSFSPDSPPRRG